MPLRRRIKQTVSLTDRLTIFANETRVKALQVAPGPKRDALLKKVKQADAAVDLERWASSPELQAPK